MTPALSLALVLLAAPQGQEPPQGQAPPQGQEPPEAKTFEVSFLYSLSTTFGALPFSDVGLSYDPAHDEIYVTGDGPVRVFNGSGMEVYSFGDSPELGAVRGVAALEDGDLLAFGYRAQEMRLVRCNFRGEVVGEVVPRNLPPQFAQWSPTAMRYRNGNIYLADTNAMRIAVLDSDGEYLSSYDIAAKLGEEKNRADLGLRGFGVDREGNMLFTIQPLFAAYIMSPDGEIRRFGQRGSAPGKFNIVGGIARDDAGNVYVADILKSAILVFDPELRFVKEFGYRGRKPGSLAAPEEIVAAGDKLFVSNRGRKGVSVFRVGSR